LRNRFFYCCCGEAIDAKEIYGFEVKVLKRFLCKALVLRDFVSDNFLDPEGEKISP